MSDLTLNHSYLLTGRRADRPSARLESGWQECSVAKYKTSRISLGGLNTESQETGKVNSSLLRSIAT